MPLPPVPDGLVPAADTANEKVDADDSFQPPVAGESPVATRPVSITCSAIQLVDGGGAGQLPLDLVLSEPAAPEG